jgi:hypothetical protein
MTEERLATNSHTRCGIRSSCSVRASRRAPTMPRRSLHPPAPESVHMEQRLLVG